MIEVYLTDLKCSIIITKFKCAWLFSLTLKKQTKKKKHGFICLSLHQYHSALIMKFSKFWHFTGQVSLVIVLFGIFLDYLCSFLSFSWTLESAHSVPEKVPYRFFWIELCRLFRREFTSLFFSLPLRWCEMCGRLFNSRKFLPSKEALSPFWNLPSISLLPESGIVYSSFD